MLKKNQCVYPPYGGLKNNKYSYMIPKNKLKLDCVITISQRFLLKEVEVNSLENLFSKDFFTFENLENLKQDSVTLPTEVVINCVELKSNNSNFIEVADKFLNLLFKEYFYCCF